MPLKQKVEAIAKKIYRADGVNFSAAASKTLAELTDWATETCRSASPRPSTVSGDNAKLTGCAHRLYHGGAEVRLAAGAGFVVVICGNIMTMPGLPKKPRRRQYRRGCRRQDHGVVLNRIYRAMYSKEGAVKAAPSLLYTKSTVRCYTELSNRIGVSADVNLSVRSTGNYTVLWNRNC